MSTRFTSLSVCYVLSSLSTLPSNMFPTLLILLLMKKMKIAIMKWSSFRGWYESVQPFNSPQRQPLAIDLERTASDCTHSFDGADGTVKTIHEWWGWWGWWLHWSGCRRWWWCWERWWSAGQFCSVTQAIAEGGQTNCPKLSHCLDLQLPMIIFLVWKTKWTNKQNKNKKNCSSSPIVQSCSFLRLSSWRRGDNDDDDYRVRFIFLNLQRHTKRKRTEDLWIRFRKSNDKGRWWL